MMRRSFVLSLLSILCLLAIFPLQVSAVEEVTGIEINPVTLQITYGERDTIYAIVHPEQAPDKRVTWTVSDSRILEISEVSQANFAAYPTLEIKALNPGRAVITAVTRDGGFRAQAVVQIVVVPVRSISMIPPDLTLTSTETFQIQASIEPSAGTLPFVTFESTNPAVASVNEVGLVVAKQPGETRIIARSVQDSSVSAFSAVTVAGLAPVEDATVPFASEGEETVIVIVEEQKDEAAGILSPLSLIVGLTLLIIIALLIFLITKGRKAPVDNFSGYTGVPPMPENRQVAPFLAGVRGISGHFAGQNINFHNNQLVIGRDPSAGIAYPLSNEQISRTHLTISYDPVEELFTLIDSSANGTFLYTHERLERGIPYKVEAGVQFYLVDTGEMFELQLS